MSVYKIIVAICSLMFIMIGLDKFMGFLEPPCSLEAEIPGVIWQMLGVIQFASALLIWSSKYRKYIVGFFSVFMFIFALVHLSQGTYDIGGAVFMGLLLLLLVWNPKFLGNRK